MNYWADQQNLVGRQRMDKRKTLSAGADPETLKTLIDMTWKT